MADGKKNIEKKATKDGKTIQPTTIATKPIVKQPTSSKALLLPPNTTTTIKTIVTTTIITDKQPSSSKARLLPPAATQKIIKQTIVTPATIKPTPVAKQTNPPKAPLLTPKPTNVPTSSKNTNVTNPTKGFEIDCLYEHNRLRALHGCPQLVLNQKLSAVSREWAIHMADKKTLEHSKQNTYGENLYMCSGLTLHGSKPAQSWYSEIKDYNFQKPGFNPATGHFTQLVWKDSKELGVGVIIRGDTTWVAAHYNPPGNILTKFEQNVPKPLVVRSDITNVPTPSQNVPTTSKNIKNVTVPTPNQGFEIDCLNEHNRLRALHGCPPLVLNPKLSVVSKDWAIHMADKNVFEHSEQTTYGENLYMCSGFTLLGSKPAQSWYSEIKDYNFQKPGFSPATGHFTQLVWKDSKELGVGVIIRGDTTWVAAHYNPPGNVLTMFEKNVPRPLGKK